MRITDGAVVYESTTNEKYQWDTDQSLTITNLTITGTVQVHFVYSGATLALVEECEVSDGTLTATIPDVCLQYSGEIIAYLYSDNTLYKITIPVVKRAKPGDYITDDDIAYINYNSVAEAYEVLRAAMDEAEEITENIAGAEYYASEAEGWTHGESFNSRETFVAEGTTFTLSHTPASITSVTVNGEDAEYTYSGDVVTISTTETGDEVIIIYSVDTSTDNAQYYAEAAETAAESIGITAGSVTVSTLAAGSDATVTISNSGTNPQAVFDFIFGIPQGATGEAGEQGEAGETGATGNGIASIDLTSGTHAAGTFDTYTITYTDGTTSTMQVYNGADGGGAGDMVKSVYDTNDDGVVDSAETISGLTASVTELNYLSGVTASVQTQIDTLDSSVSGIESDVSTLSTTVTTVQSDVSTLNTTVTTVQSDVSTLNTTVTGIQSDVSTLQTDVDTVESDLSTHTAEVVNSSTGAHGLRYYEDTLSYDNNGTWTEIETGGGGGGTSPTLTLSTQSVTVSDTATVTATYAGSGTISATSADTSIATVSASGNTVTITAVADGNTTVTISLSASGDYIAADAPVDVSVSMTSTAIYGAYWDGTSTTAWSRTDDAETFSDPSPAISSGDGSSPFDEIEPWASMVRVTDATGGELVAIPKYYYCWTSSGSTLKLQISMTQHDGYLVSPAHADRGDGEKDVVYVGRYHCNSSYVSATSASPLASITRATARSGISALGSGYYQYDFAMYWTIMMLYLVEYADWNSQATIGYGCSTSSAIMTMGYTDSMTYHTGTTASARTTYGGTQYRYIEGLWDNVFDWCDGIYFSDTSVYCIADPDSFSDSSGGTLVATRPSSGGYISAWTVPSVSGFEYALYPSAVSGSDSTYCPDYCSYGASGVVLRVGGNYGQITSYGAFYLNGSYAASGASAVVGCRLQYIPPAS